MSASKEVNDWALSLPFLYNHIKYNDLVPETFYFFHIKYALLGRDFQRRILKLCNESLPRWHHQIGQKCKKKKLCTVMHNHPSKAKIKVFLLLSPSSIMNKNLNFFKIAFLFLDFGQLFVLTAILYSYSNLKSSSNF